MRVTIIKDDEVVGVDGIFRSVDLTDLSPGIRVVQWDGAAGHVEFDYGPNEVLEDIAPFQSFIDLWTAAAPPAPTPPTDAQRINNALARINSAYQDAVAALTTGYPADEVASWPKQEEEARAYIASPGSAVTPWMDAASLARGITRADLANLIITNADLFLPVHGELTGKRQKLRDQIAALGSTPTQQQLDAIQW